MPIIKNVHLISVQSWTYLPISKFDVYRDLCTINEIIFEYSDKRSVFKV